MACKELSHCHRLFHCRKSTICVHLGDLCNKRKDCPYADDELACALIHVTCPSGCTCLLFAIRGDNTIVDSKFQFPYQAIWVQDSVVSGVCSKMFSQAVLFHIDSGNFIEFCEVFKEMKYLVTIQSQRCSITKVQSDCFSRNEQARIIVLQNDTISIIERCAFCKIEQLLLLNISDNSITTTDVNIFCGVLKVVFFSVENNTKQILLGSLYNVMSVFIFQTKDEVDCCLFKVHLKCFATRFWYFSCTNLLPSTIHRHISYLLVVMFFVANTLSFISQITAKCFVKQNNLRKAGAASNFTIITFINTSDLLHAISLFLLLIADHVGRNNVVFLTKVWKSNIFCFLIYFLLLNHALLSSALLCFLVLTRLMITIHPVKTHFKCQTFATKSLIMIASINVAMT